ncbi:MAG: hypothetical protein ACRDYA_10350 [Egibacteraceae bacterium]
MSARALAGLDLQEQSGEPAGKAARIRWLPARALPLTRVARRPAAGRTDWGRGHALARVERDHRAPP